MTRTIITFLIISIILLSCNNSISTHEKKNDNDEYSKILTFFRDSLVNHFPKNEPMKIGRTLQWDTACYHNTVSFELVLFNAKKIIDSTLNFYSKKTLVQYNSSDSCLLVVNDYLTLRNCGDPFIAAESTYIEGCSNDKLPVPNFWYSDLAKNETRCGLPKDYVFYVLDSKIGIFSKKINTEQSSMPKHMQHGYSKGLAISKEKNTIIFWVIVW